MEWLLFTQKSIDTGWTDASGYQPLFSKVSLHLRSQLINFCCSFNFARISLSSSLLLCDSERASHSLFLTFSSTPHQKQKKSLIDTLVFGRGLQLHLYRSVHASVSFLQTVFTAGREREREIYSHSFSMSKIMVYIPSVFVIYIHCQRRVKKKTSV